VASQVVSAAKRLRISYLLDAYGELLTEKQRTFLKHYYEEDLSFGEIAQEYNVSRQAIFDSVRHGEQTLEHFEKVLRLVDLGFSRLLDEGVQVQTIAQRLQQIRQRLADAPDFNAKPSVIAQLDELADWIGGAEPPPQQPSE
jgi:hypothetical protein